MRSPIRIAEAGDLDRLEAMMASFYAEAGYPREGPGAAAALAALVGDPGLGRLWLILAGNEPVGYVAVTFGFSLEFHGRDAFIDEIFIRPPFRGAGLGGRVLAAVEPECRALGIRALHLEVERGNPAGQALYRRHGFRDADRLLLSKRLAQEPPR
jgi:GNAT superfamily N-acetyltransferase